MMKIQYLGDSKDSFKWDYQDFLVDYLGYGTLDFVPMLTPDDGTNHGTTHPQRYPARPEIIDFCHRLRAERKLDSVKALPNVTDSDYQVVIHRPDGYLVNASRAEYFQGIGRPEDQLVFLDPDNGFEPRYFSEKHIRYSELESILDQCTENSVVSVFQHWRRRKFDGDFRDIQSQLLSGHAAAIFGRYVMFVAISRSKEAIESVITANELYAANKRVATVSESNIGNSDMNKKLLKARTNGVYGLETKGNTVSAHLNVSADSKSGRRKLRRMAKHLQTVADNAEAEHSS